MDVRVIRHAEGEEREKHKYVARVHLGKKGDKNLYRYFYDRESYQAYLKEEEEKKKKSEGNKLSDLVGKLFSGKSDDKNSEEGASFLNKLFKSKDDSDELVKEVKTKAAEVTNKGEAKVNQILNQNGDQKVNSLQTTAHKVLDFLEDVGKGIGAAITNAINAVERFKTERKIRNNPVDNITNEDVIEKYNGPDPLVIKENGLKELRKEYESRVAELDAEYDKEIKPGKEAYEKSVKKLEDDYNRRRSSIEKSMNKQYADKRTEEFIKREGAKDLEKLEKQYKEERAKLEKSWSPDKKSIDDKYRNDKYELKKAYKKQEEMINNWYEANRSDKTDKKNINKDTSLYGFVESGKAYTESFSNQHNDVEMGDLKDVGNAILSFISTTLVNGIGAAVATAVVKAVDAIQDKIEDIKEEKEEKEERIKEDVITEEIIEEEIIKENIIKEEKIEEEIDIEFPDLNRKDREYSKDEDQAAVNPNYDPDASNRAVIAYYTGDEEAYNKYLEENYEYNCSYCTATYDLRQRGYDVEAMPINMNDDDPTNAAEIASWYEGGAAAYVNGYDVMEITQKQYDAMEPLKEKQVEDFIDSLEKHEEGSYGHLLLYWAYDGGGHDVIWEIENGKAIVRDCQTNETLDPREYLQDCYYADYFRSDDLELADEIRRVVRNRD